jgi:general secretion pathway protein A
MNVVAVEERSCLNFFGFHQNPFPVAPDSENFYISEHIEKILADIIYGINARKGFMILTGEVGLGKTTISRRLISIMEAKGHFTSLVFQTAFRDVELIREINRDFGIKTDSLIFADQMKILNEFLLVRNQEGRNCIIIIDDAQNLNFKSLEMIRMISNLEADGQKLVQILLVGQPELVDLLDSVKLRQLKSRVVIREETRALKKEEMENYILFRLNRAGDRGLTRVRHAALKQIHRFTRGNFRQINLLMDRCLYVAFLYNTVKIGKRLVTEAHHDLSPEKKQPQKRLLIFVFSALVLMMSAFGAAYNYSGRVFNPPVSVEKRYQVPSLPNNRSTINLQKRESLKEDFRKLSNNSGFDGAGEDELVIADADTLGPVMDFLRSYQLDGQASGFAKALKGDDFTTFSGMIYDQTGYELIRLSRISDHIRETYGLLYFESERSGHENWLLFWKPPFRIDAFYKGYQGDSIRKLSSMLADTGFYKGIVGNSVDGQLVDAIKVFQERESLSATGYPDVETLFRLFLHQRRSAHGR